MAVGNEYQGAITLVIPNTSEKYSCERHGEVRPCERRAQTRVTQPQARDAWCHQKLEEARNGESGSANSSNLNSRPPELENFKVLLF